jgi:hypothetical protein
MFPSVIGGPEYHSIPDTPDIGNEHRHGERAPAAEHNTRVTAGTVLILGTILPL